MTDDKLNQEDRFNSSSSGYATNQQMGTNSTMCSLDRDNLMNDEGIHLNSRGNASEERIKAYVDFRPFYQNSEIHKARSPSSNADPTRPALYLASPLTDSAATTPTQDSPMDHKSVDPSNNAD